MSNRPPQLPDVLRVLRDHAGDLRRRGVVHAAVFGSVARGEAGPDSDVDILVTLDRDNLPDLFTYSGIGVDLEEWLGRSVDVANRDRLKPLMREQILREAIDAF